MQEECAVGATGMVEFDMEDCVKCDDAVKENYSKCQRLKWFISYVCLGIICI